MSNRADDVLSVAGGEVGYSRWTDQEAGTKYGRWYADLTGDSYFAQSGVPFCAMFVSWVFAQAGATCQGIPGAYCPWVLDAGRDAGALVSCSDAQPGDVVLFDWDGGVCDHVGIVESNDGRLHTIEGNTNGGKVARRTRAYGYVAGIIRPLYGSDPATAPSGRRQVSVDGNVGPDSTSAWQQVMGTEQDGVISGQDAGCDRLFPNLSTRQYGSGGSDLVRAIQAMMGIDQDGNFGPDTIRHWQGEVGTNQDGSFGPATATATQQWLNGKL